MQGHATQYATTTKTVWIVAFYALLSLAILSPVSSSIAIPNLGDYIGHLAAIIQAKTALMQGQFPLRTMPLEYEGLGYPHYQFYSPTLYTFVGLIYGLITPKNPLEAFTIAIWFSLMMGSLSMYRLAYWFIRSQPAAILAGVVYLYAPYYVILIDRLGNLPEIMALGILPAVLYYTVQRYYHPHSHKNLLILSLLVYLFITIHLQTAVYSSLLFFILLALISSKNKMRFKNWISVGIAYGFGCLMAFWFLAPAIFLQKFFLLSQTYVDPNHLILYHPSLSNLLFGAATLTSGYKSSALMTIHPSIGFPIVAALAVYIYALCNNLSSGRKRADYWMPALLIVFVIAFLLVWSPINFWRWLPQPLLIAQYCWRLMGQVIWMGSLFFAWSVYWLFKGKLDARHILLGTLLIIISVNSWFPSTKNFYISLENFIKQPNFIYNGNALLINYNKFPHFVSKIDSLQMDENHLLRTNSSYFIPRKLIKLAADPKILIRGEASNNVQLTFTQNRVPLAIKNINRGKFSWEIPLNLNHISEITTVEFFSNNGSLAENQVKIPTEEFVMSGFLQENEVVNLRQILPNCTQQKTVKSCQLMVPPTVKLVELPELFYPNLLKITLNGKEIAYNSVIYQGRLIAAIIPEPGVINKITIQFRGLDWANECSWTGWGLWFLVLIQTLIYWRKAQ